MYFPTLSTMSRFQIDEFLYNKLDIWLGTRRKAVRNFLSPIQFSLDCEIDQETSISLFVICTEKDINLLKQRYVVECPCCQRLLGEYLAPADIPFIIDCPECGKNIKVNRDMIVIWFKLTQEPLTQPYQINIDMSLMVRESVGKDISLRPEHIEASENPMVRRLFSGYNERLRSS
ncbi:hypothetical protein [Paenibacillus thailandensis]|uniref:Adenylate kinase n=1 Tax=Paenibacillus thailandensis TaxID=393250 RepID=A0ABW5R6B2_9BACL